MDDDAATPTTTPTGQRPHGVLVRARATVSRWPAATWHHLTRPRHLDRRRTARAAGRWAGLLAVAVVGAGLGWSLSPPVRTWVGPIEVGVEVVASPDPGVHVQLPPVGQVEFDTHGAPVAVRASVLAVDLEGAQRLIDSPQGLLALQLTAPDVVADAARRSVLQGIGLALAGAVVASVVVYRRPKRVLQTTATATVALLLLGAGTAVTFDGAALRQPRFTGLLSSAPYIAGEGREVAARLESYRSGLADFVRSVTTLYAVADQLAVLPRGDGETTTVLHVSDIHLNPLAFDLADRLVTQFGVDVVVDTGDITTWGTDVESSTLSRIGGLGVPYVFVRGNHDSLATQEAVAAQEGAVVLDGDVTQVAGLTFAGIGDPVFTPDGGGDADADRALVEEATTDLADLVDAHAPDAEPADDGSAAPDPGTTTPGAPEPGDAVAGPGEGPVAAPDRGVDVALLHDPGHLDPLYGKVPLVLAGHLHRRVTRVDESSGTRIMVQGSTGGAGLTVRGLERLEAGEPLPLTATLLYFATSGERAGRLVAYDEVTVGGLGLTSVTVERTTVPVWEPPAEEPDEGSEEEAPDAPEEAPDATGAPARPPARQRGGPLPSPRA